MAGQLVAQAQGGPTAQPEIPTVEFEEVGGDHALSPDLEGTHGEVHDSGHSEVFPPFDSSTFAGQLIWLAITFALLYVLMSRVALPRIGNIIDQRQARIDGDLAAAEHSRKKTDEAIAAYEAALAAARAKAHAMAEETRAGIKSDIDGKRARVEQDLAAKIAGAEASIAATKVEAMGKVDEIAAETVQALVAQISAPVSEAEARAAVAQASKE